jgi:hypothetical protein
VKRSLQLTILAGFIFLVALTLAACQGQTPTLTVDANSVATQAAQTIEAMLTVQAVTAQAPVAASPTSEPEQPATATSTPTAPPTDTPTPEPSLTPEPSATTTPCDDKAEFVTDVTVPDDTILLPGETFIKTWQLKNVGSCTWTTSYAVVFSEGDLMGGKSPTLLTAEVKPEGTVDISVEMKAPGTTGTYRGDWKLQNTAGQIFGIGKDADKTFWVQIVVQEGAEELNLGNPTWTDPFDSSSNWYPLNTDNTEWEFKDGQLIMKAKSTSAPEEWGLSNKPAIKNFFLEARFKTGGTCDGLDRYGVLVRAPDPNKGYVFEFSCDGRFRIYKWDGENYKAIQEWKASSSIFAGSDQNNRLGIWMKGKTIRLYANGQLLGEYEDDTYDEGRFGLVIGADQTEDFTVSVDEVSYWILSD